MSDPDRASRIRTVLLPLSLCLNVILITLLVVGFGKVVQASFITHPGGQLQPGAIVQAVAPDRQQAVREIVADHAGPVLTARRQARKARIEAFRLFADPNFNADAFAKALEDVRQADSNLEEEAISTLRDVIAGLTPQERKSVIERARRGANRPWWRRLLQPTVGEPQG